jgi:hypothetical protein
LLKAITSSLSLVKHSNDWGKSTSKFFCKSRYCKFWHRPSSKGSWDNALQLRFSSVMWRVRCFNLQYSINQCKLSISTFCGVLNNLVEKSDILLLLLPSMSQFYTGFSYVCIQNFIRKHYHY